MTVGDSCVELRKEKTIVHARQEKEHSKKMNRKEDQWDGKRTGTRRQLICSITFSEKKCVDCRTLTKACVKCENCRTIMCWKCDEKLHSRLVLHDRKIFDGQRRIFLAQSEFINALKDIFEKGLLQILTFKPIYSCQVNNSCFIYIQVCACNVSFRMIAHIVAKCTLWSSQWDWEMSQSLVLTV